MGTRDLTALFLSDDEWQDVVKETNKAIELSLLSGTPEPAFDYGRNIIREGRIKGVKLAGLFYELRRVWTNFQTGGDRVEDAVEREVGVPKDSFVKYADAFEHVVLKRPALAGKPIEGLIKLIAASREGQLEEEDWNELEMAHNVGAMLAVRDRVRGVHTSGNTRLYRWRSPEGQLYCKRGPEGEIKQFGFLYPNTGDEDVDAAVSVTLASGIIDN